MAGLGKSPLGQQLKALIKTCSEDSNAKLRILTGEMLIREQGRAQMLDELTGLLEGPKLTLPRDLSARRPAHFDSLA